MLEDNLLPTDNVLLEQNALVINTGDRVVLFDTGAGTGKVFGPDSGRLLSNLKAAGIDPKDVDAVVLTHAHPDHCFALMADDGTRNFPNAQIYMAQADLEFWTDEGKLANDMIGAFVDGARKHLLPNRDRMVFVKDGQEILPGIQAMAAPGHTVGHTIYMITSQGKSVCNVGDLAHHHVLSVETPRREFVYDTDGKQAVATRLRVFDMLASSRTPFVTYHFPWPGLGHVAKQRRRLSLLSVADAHGAVTTPHVRSSIPRPISTTRWPGWSRPTRGSPRCCRWRDGRRCGGARAASRAWRRSSSRSSFRWRARPRSGGG